MSDIQQRTEYLNIIMKSRLSTENLGKLVNVIQSVKDPNATVPKIEKFIKSPLAKPFM